MIHNCKFIIMISNLTYGVGFCRKSPFEAIDFNVKKVRKETCLFMFETEIVVEGHKLQIVCKNARCVFVLKSQCLPFTGNSSLESIKKHKLLQKKVQKQNRKIAERRKMNSGMP